MSAMCKLLQHKMTMTKLEGNYWYRVKAISSSANMYRVSELNF